MSEYTPEYWIKCLRDPGWVGRQFNSQMADCFEKLLKERHMYKAQVETFRKNAPKMMTRNDDGELIPLDKQAVGVTLPALLDALGAKLAGRDITSMVNELDKARDLTDVQKYVLSFLKGPGDGGGVGDIGVMLKTMLAKVPTGGEISHAQTRPEETGRLGAAGAGSDADSVDSSDTAVPDREAVPTDNRVGNGHDDKTGEGS